MESSGKEPPASADPETNAPRFGGSLRRSLLGWFLILALGPLTLVSAIGYSQARDQLRQEAIHNLEANAASRSRFFHNWIDYRFMDLHVQAKSLGNVQFPLVADITKNISRDYGVLFNDAVSLRGLFLIDKEGVVRHSVVNDLPLGRNVDEALRTLNALQYTEEHGEVCPANWQPGEEAMTPTADGVANYLSKHA